MHKRRNSGRRLEKPIRVRAASRIPRVLTPMPPLRVRSALARNRRCAQCIRIYSAMYVAGRNGCADGRIQRGTLNATLQHHRAHLNSFVLSTVLYHKQRVEHRLWSPRELVEERVSVSWPRSRIRVKTTGYVNLHQIRTRPKVETRRTLTRRSGLVYARPTHARKSPDVWYEAMQTYVYWQVERRWNTFTDSFLRYM